MFRIMRSMKQIKSTQLRQPNQALEPALFEPLAITFYGRVKYVVLSKAQYDELIELKEERDKKEEKDAE